MESASEAAAIPNRVPFIAWQAGGGLQLEGARQVEGKKTAEISPQSLEISFRMNQGVRGDRGGVDLGELSARLRRSEYRKVEAG